MHLTMISKCFSWSTRYKSLGLWWKSMWHRSSWSTRHRSHFVIDRLLHWSLFSATIFFRLYLIKILNLESFCSSCRRIFWYCSRLQLLVNTTKYICTVEHLWPSHFYMSARTASIYQVWWLTCLISTINWGGLTRRVIRRAEWLRGWCWWLMVSSPHLQFPAKQALLYISRVICTLVDYPRRISSCFGDEGSRLVYL